MIKIIPPWLQEAVNWLNQKYPEEEDVNMTILYGYDTVCAPEEAGTGFAVYNALDKNIYLADPKEIQESCGISEEDAKITSIENLFHEYRHHQQNIRKLPFNEEDAEEFAVAMYKQYEKEKERNRKL